MAVNFIKLRKKGRWHEIPIYDVFSIDHVPTLGRTYYRLIHSTNLKIGGIIMHIVKDISYDDGMKIANNYKEFERKIKTLEDELARTSSIYIKELEDELAIYKKAEKIYPEITFLVSQCRPESNDPKYNNR